MGSRHGFGCGGLCVRNGLRARMFVEQVDDLAARYGRHSQLVPHVPTGSDHRVCVTTAMALPPTVPPSEASGVGRVPQDCVDGERAGAFSGTDQGDSAVEGVYRIQGDLPVEVDVVGELGVVIVDADSGRFIGDGVAATYLIGHLAGTAV